MLTSRRVILAGFPLLFVLLVGALAHFAAVRYQDERRDARDAAQRDLHATLAQARATARALQRDRLLEQQAAWARHEAQCRAVLDRIQALLARALQSANDDTSEGETEGRGWGSLLQTFGMNLRAPETLPEPRTVLAEERPALANLLPAGAQLTVRTQEGDTLLSVTRGEPEAERAAPLHAAFTADHAQGPVAWSLALATPFPDLPPDPGPEALARALAADETLAEQLGARTALAVLDEEGAAVAAVPAGAFPPQAQEMPRGQWTELDASEAGAARMGLLAGTDTDLGIEVVGRRVLIEPDAAAWLRSEVRAQPALLAAPLAGLVLAVLGVAWAVARGRTERAAASAKGRARTRPSPAHGNDAGATELATRERPVQRPSADRPSNLPRLRRLYGSREERAGLQLTGRVRSDVLRELLRRVGGNGEGDQDV